jgi:class 3 adenylate cyclase
VVEAPRLDRKLVAILAADIEGYSRQMERDEAGTLAILSSHRLIVDELIASHNGRITGTAGDSVLAEFASVVDALDCALKIQDRLAEANANLPSDDRLMFRIGINVGDVMLKDGDIFGDGVNIAARLESLATPGGVCISRGVRDHVRKMDRYAFEDLGEQSVKNIAQPIRAFRVRLSDAPPADEDERPREPAISPEPDRISVPTPPATPVAGDSPEFELAFWESIKDSQDPAEFAAYLDKYPHGTFAALAETRRTALTKEDASAPKEPEVDPIELAYWDTMKDSDNSDMFRAYLERYPQGAFAPLAKVRLEELGVPPPHETA